MTEGEWYARLTDLADKFGESVADRVAWVECYEDGKTPEEAFFEDYPEYRDLYEGVL